MGKTTAWLRFRNNCSNGNNVNCKKMEMKDWSLISKTHFVDPANHLVLIMKGFKHSRSHKFIFSQTSVITESSRKREDLVL